MERKLIWLGCAICLVASLALAAAAHPAPARACGQMAPLIQAHKDGLTRTDFLAWRAAQFDRLDWQKRGALSATSAPFAARARMTEMITLFDANKDGVVTRDEFVKGPTPMFDAADANRDQRVTQAEFNAVCPKA